MNLDFYNSPIYKQKQSLITKRQWAEGKHNSLVKSDIERVCKKPNCANTFWSKPGNPKLYCCRSCAASDSNEGKIKSLVTREKISQWMKTHAHFLPSNNKVPRVETICQNPHCNNHMFLAPWESRRRKYCSVDCSIKIIGRMTTSPKASKGKLGIRLDVDPSICFYSTWEANIARVYNLVGINWIYSPTTFDLGAHTYRPDFFLPESNIYIEVKNFLNPYSVERDRLFREKFPDVNLVMILKDEYKTIEMNYKDLIPEWE